MEARPKILIVEDNAELVSILQMLLSDDYDVVAAYNGEDGIVSAVDRRPDIVILDLHLPHMGGVEVGQRIKQQLGVPILVLSAHADKGGAEAILSSGCCDAFIAKPAPLDTIRSKVVELLDSARQAHA